ncbi:hypothetical protein [Pseudoclavibacter sp. 8L]|uniref:hypothetical protein n=1 Tax=Pseudoclavibacter sp. 8L TaxID=2653162 RepID=UPI0012F19F6B|nr:hypothetical protein [Pseudoclavibacter sp. 8L]VXB33683.1 conserved hypothetical protein [Pseudoclavibacter sp. 8L]
MRAPELYLAKLQALPELFVHLAAIAQPTRQQADGLPVSRDMQSTPVRLVPLDDLSQIFIDLWRAERVWRERLGRRDLIDTAYMVSFDEWGDWTEGALHPRGILTDERWSEQVKVWAQTLVNRFVVFWPDVARDPGWPAFAAELEEWAVKMPARWPLEGRRPVPVKPRPCPECERLQVYADGWSEDEDGIRCYSCQWTYRPELWLPIKEAAERQGVTVHTVQNWIARPHSPLIALPMRKDAQRRRMVERDQVRDYAALMAQLRVKCKPLEVPFVLSGLPRVRAHAGT